MTPKYARENNADQTRGGYAPTPRERIQSELNRARVLHPQPWHGTLHALGVLIEEVAEVVWALIKRDKANLRQELAQVAAVCWRWLERLDKEAR